MTFKTLSVLAGAALGLTVSGAALAQAITSDEIRRIIFDSRAEFSCHEFRCSTPATFNTLASATLTLAMASMDSVPSPELTAEAEVREIVASAMAEASTKPAPAAVAAANPYETIAATTAPTLVTIKFTMKISSQRGDDERPMEVSGVVIGKDGLVLASNALLNPASVRPGGGFTAVPTDLKILIGDDTEGVAARLIGTDKELDLAWVQIEKPVAEGYKALDLSASGAPTLGAEVISVERMGKIVDRAPKILVGRAAGVTTKPRKLYMTDGLSAYFGDPVFNADGKLIGIISLQLPDGDFDETVSSEMRRLGYLILPAENIASATKRVLEQEAERAKSAGEAPKAAPEAEKKPEGEKK